MSKNNPLSGYPLMLVYLVNDLSEYDTTFNMKEFQDFFELSKFLAKHELKQRQYAILQGEVIKHVVDENEQLLQELENELLCGDETDESTDITYLSPDDISRLIEQQQQ